MFILNGFNPFKELNKLVGNKISTRISAEQPQHHIATPFKYFTIQQHSILFFIIFHLDGKRRRRLFQDVSHLIWIKLQSIVLLIVYMVVLSPIVSINLKLLVTKDVKLLAMFYGSFVAFASIMIIVLFAFAFCAVFISSNCYYSMWESICMCVCLSRWIHRRTNHSHFAFMIWKSVWINLINS